MNQQANEKTEAILSGVFFRSSEDELSELEKVHSLEYIIENDTMVLMSNVIVHPDGNTDALLEAIREGHREIVLVGKVGEDEIEMKLTDFKCRIQGRFPIETITFETKSFSHWKPFQNKEN